MKQRKTRRFLALLTALTMTASMVPAALAADEAAGGGAQPSIENFKKVRSYETFGDVDEKAWYFSDMRGAYEMGLINGSGEGKMNPGGTLTLAEAITLGCNVCHTYRGDDYTPGGSPWYQNAVDYAKKNYLIPSEGYSDYTVPAMRAEVARIFANSIFPADLARINHIAWIPDVGSNTIYRTQVYALYNAGVLAGSTGGSFRPGANITRAETAAIMNRLVDPSKRVKFSLTDGHAPGTAAESKEGAVRVYYDANAGWSVTPGEYKQGESDSLTLSHKDGGAQIEIRIDFKKAVKGTMEEMAANAAKQVTEQGYTLDSNPYTAWLHGLFGYTFEYHYGRDDGSTGYGEFSCVENSSCFVSVQVTYADNCANEVIDQMWNIYNSLDLPL